MGAREDVLITAEELARRLAVGEPMTLLDVRWELGDPDGAAAYERGHLPGAVYVSLDDDLTDHSVTGRGRHPLPSGRDLQDAARRWGVRSGVPVVVYDDWNRAGSSRAWWVLTAAGIPDVRILDGGLSAWAGELHTGTVTPDHGEVTIAHQDLYAAARGTVTADAASEGGRVLLDARAPERYRGEAEPVDPVAGHIPGALNMPSSGLLTGDGFWRPGPELTRLFDEHGARRGADVAVYCGSGVTAAVAIAGLASVGVDAALFPGSWSEWSSDPTRPVATGSASASRHPMTITGPDVDLLDGEFYAYGDARTAYAWMRANQPVFRDRNGLAAATTYQAVIDAERAPEVFSNAGGIRPDQAPMPQMIDMDDPEHLLRRKLVNSGFTRKRVRDKEASIGKVVDTLIDAVCERGECDFVWDLAAPLPMAVIGDMLGVRPEQREMFLKWSDDLVVALSSTVAEANWEAAVEAYTAYTQFTLDTIAARRKEPTDDLTSVLVYAEVDGERLTDEQIVSETLLILIGGDETSRHTLSGGTEQLIRHPEQWEQLQRHPDTLLPGAIEEMLRWTSPIKNMARTVTQDIEFHGTQLGEDEKILLMFESANFDESVFDDPNSFQITRNPNSHVAFGFGTHFCLGNQLARLELNMMTRRVLERLPDLQLASEDPLPLRPANFVSGLESMPVVFTPSNPLGSG